ncbi:MAG: class F sortase [Candidatus Dormibacteria bacterium]
MTEKLLDGLAAHRGSVSAAPAAALLAAMLAMAGCGAALAPPATLSRADVPLSPTTPTPTPATPVPKPSAAPALSLVAAPVNTPLVLAVPRVGLSAPVLAVGKNRAGQMDAPFGPANSQIWDEAFWYRDGATPGAPGTATIAGHVTDTLARLRVFSRICQMTTGDGIEVRNTKTGETMHFRVTEARAYTLAQASAPAILNRIFGLGANTGRSQDKAADAAGGVAHLTLITCTGSWVGNGFNQRFVVYAVRDS